jgi:hypothetical protein
MQFNKRPSSLAIRETSQMNTHENRPPMFFLYSNSRCEAIELGLSRRYCRPRELSENSIGVISGKAGGAITLYRWGYRL